MANSQLDPQTVENNNEKENIYLVKKCFGTFGNDAAFV